MRAVRLRKPLERTIAHGHAWIYADALEPHGHQPGDEVRVLDRRGRFLARGWAEEGAIGVRVLSRRDEPADETLIRRRVDEAFSLRERVVPPETDAYRLLHGEGDGLPGMVLDRYGPRAVLKLDGSAAHRWRKALVLALSERLPGVAVDHLLWRKGRGPDKTTEALMGAVPPGDETVHERGMKLLVNLTDGQKTGMFLDHRDSRFRVRGLSKGLDVLNLYAYTGGFSVSAGMGGAKSVTTVDIAPGATALAAASFETNGLDPARHRVVTEDVPTFLKADDRRYGLIVADPPSFAPNQSAKPNALKAYQKLHEACLRKVERGGLYLAASCSSHVHRADFEATIDQAAHNAKRPVAVLGRWGAGADHPVPLGFPEWDYLTCTLLRVG